MTEPPSSTTPLLRSAELENTNDGSSAKVISFDHSDLDNPRNFSRLRKWTIVGAITLIDLSVSWGASGYSPAQTSFIADFAISERLGVLGLSLYVLGLALGPMTIAPLSEHYGRTMLYVVPYGTYLLLLAGTATVQTLAGFLALRFFSGVFASVTIANFGGTIADLWPRHEVGVAMSIFLWAAVCGSPSGYFLLSFVAQYKGWRDVFWALLGVCGGLWVVLVVVLVGGDNETRHSVLLRRRARRMNAQRHGSHEVEVPEEMKKKSLQQLFGVTLSRPFRFLATEPIVVFAATYNGYLYGLSFLFNGAFSLIFGAKGYGFDTIGVGSCFLGLVLGISLGPFINLWQEHHYQTRIRSAGSRTQSDNNGNTAHHEHLPNIPEARVQLGKLAAVLLPISLLWFAWTSPPQYAIHWITPVLATVLFGYSFYTLILMSYLYVEDSFMVYSASALAGVGLARNLAGAGESWSN